MSSCSATQLIPNTSHSCEQSTHFIFWTNCSAYKYALVFSCSALFIVLMPGDVRCNSCGTRTRVKLQIALFALLRSVSFAAAQCSAVSPLLLHSVSFANQLERCNMSAPTWSRGEIQRFQWIAQRKWIDLSLNWHWAPSSISPPDVDIFLFNPHRQNSM